MLLQTVGKYLSKTQGWETPVYARYVTLAQSSGTGKSRLVDEVAKQVLVIPFNLREAGIRGDRYFCLRLPLLTP